MKALFLDLREAFKLFIVARYIFLLAVFVPMVCVANQYLLFQGSLSVFLFVFLIIYETLILLIAISKIVTSKLPMKVLFINTRYGHQFTDFVEPPLAPKPSEAKRKVSELTEMNLAPYQTETPIDS